MSTYQRGYADGLEGIARVLVDPGCCTDDYQRGWEAGMMEGHGITSWLEDAPPPSWLERLIMRLLEWLNIL